jgi:hypothetical protein
MSNRALKLAVALSIFMALPAASFAGGFARQAWYAETGSMPIRSIPHGPPNAGELDSASDRSDGQRSLPEAPVGHRQPRADQVPPEDNLMNPKDPVNQEDAAIDRMLNICRGC